MAKKLIGKSVPGFLLVGVGNTLLSMAPMFLLEGLGYRPSTTIVYVAGTVMSFFLSHHFTFHSEETLGRSVVKLAVNVAVRYVVGYGLARLIVDGPPSLIAIPAVWRERFSKLVCIGLYTALNYFGQRFLAFRRKNSQGGGAPPSEKEVFMERFLSILLALTLALTLGIPTLAVEHQAGDTYIHILGSSDTRAVGVRTTYGVYRQTADSAMYRDDRYEFVYIDDGVSWVFARVAESSLDSGMYDGTQFLAGPFGNERPTWCSADGGHWTAPAPEEQDTAPAIQQGRSSPSGLTFTLRGGWELWVTDGQGRAVELTADSTSFLANYDMADVQAYPVPQGIRVEVYSWYDYEAGASHIYPAAELKQRLAAAQPELLRVTVEGEPVTFPISLYQVSGCTMAPLRQMAQAFGYTFDCDGSSETVVCARGTNTISVHAASTQATADGKITNRLAVPVELRGGIFCVSVRFFTEMAGADVTWDAAGQTFYLTTAIQEG